MQSAIAPRISGRSVPVIPIPACVIQADDHFQLVAATYGNSRMSCAHPETRLCAVFGADPENVFAAALISEWTVESPVTGPRSDTFHETGRTIDSVSHFCSSEQRKSGLPARNFASAFMSGSGFSAGVNFISKPSFASWRIFQPPAGQCAPRESLRDSHSGFSNARRKAEFRTTCRRPFRGRPRA